MSLDLDELERLANAATPGPWSVDENLTISSASTIMVAECSCAVSSPRWAGTDYATPNHMAANAKLIASLAPDVVLELIRMARASQQVQEESEPKPATGEDLQIYKDIAANYFKGSQQAQSAEVVAYMFEIRYKGKGRRDQFAAIDYNLQEGEELISKEPLSYAAPQESVNEELLKAALDWWESNRPLAWSLSEHIANPAVNCPDDTEKRLAHAVAAIQRAEAARKGK